MDCITIMWCIGSAAAGFLLGYFYRAGFCGYTDGGIIDEQERGITIGPVPPGPRSTKPRKPRRNGR